MQEFLAVVVTPADEMQNPDVQVLARSIRTGLYDREALNLVRDEKQEQRRSVRYKACVNVLRDRGLMADREDMLNTGTNLIPPAPNLRWRYSFYSQKR
jgi:hypothetical protein